ncbi:MAG: N-acetyl-gamma-glutamyl-phosphate reductase, partial [Candidatus Omnitrophica bacterium]|nr:N-acetyl-gamma-glutamyl-phosphate reductase [Candidatus Omnitrophota bacterium]
AGATGYAGEELIRILQQHPSVQLTTLAASAKWDRPVPLAQVFPRFAGQCDLPVEALDPVRLTQSCDVAFLALPHGVSMDLAPPLLSAGRKVIDLAGDFRLRDAAAFQHWYGKAHTHPDLLAQAVYGIPELFADRIRAAVLVANPGCYATSVILALAPLLQAALIEPGHIIVDAKSGWTGAGRQTVEQWESTDTLGDLWPYKVNGHQHMPEMEQALAAFACNGAPSLTFVPHVVPMERGIMSTLYLRLTGTSDWERVDRLYRERYRDAAFVRIRPNNQWPQVRDVAGTNYCDIAFGVDPAKRLLIVIAAIDNLLKGAAGQAVQNLNLMCGWPETTGLL